MPLFWKDEGRLLWLNLLLKVTHLQHVCQRADIHLNIYISGVNINPKKKSGPWKSVTVGAQFTVKHTAG